MEAKLFKIIMILTLLANLSCKAQQEYPLLDTSPFDIPANTYMKDYNNQLDFYVGTWKASFDNKVYLLTITKQIKKMLDYRNVYQDVLQVKYEVKTSNEILTINSNIGAYVTNASDHHAIYSFGLKNNGSLAKLYYGGTNCGIGWGVIEFTKLNATQFNWKYSPNSSTINDDVCPPGQDLKIYLPITSNLVFTKQ
jgi:hypothetical protein